MGRYSVELVGESHFQSGVARCSPGDPVRLVPEPGNRFDPRAVMVQDVTGAVIGYLPRDGWLTRVLLDDGTPVRASVLVIVGGAPDKPSRGVVLEVRTGADVGGARTRQEVPVASAVAAPVVDPLYPPASEFGAALGALFGRKEKRPPNSFESCMGCGWTVLALAVLFAVLGQCMGPGEEPLPLETGTIQAP